MGVTVMQSNYKIIEADFPQEFSIFPYKIDHEKKIIVLNKSCKERKNIIVCPFYRFSRVPQ